MDENRLPTFLWVPQSDGKEVMLNLNLVRHIEIGKDSLRLVFSEAYNVNLTGPIVPELLSLLESRCCFTSKGQLLVEALREVRSQLSQSQEPPIPPPVS